MKPKLWLALILTVLLMGATGVIVWQTRSNLARGRLLAQGMLQNQRLSNRIADLDRQLSDARSAAEVPPTSPAPAALAENPADSQYARVAAEHLQMIQRLQERLAQATNSINQLENRVLESQGQIHQLREDNQRLVASESDLRENLGSSNRLADALQKELKAKNDRILQIEITDQKLRQQTSTDTQRFGQVTQAITDLQEIHLRQETALKGILRRYREVTEQYRALSGVLENRRGDPAAINSVDLSRIQNSIALAEEDLRQFSSLTAQAQRIERKIAGKSP